MRYLEIAMEQAEKCGTQLTRAELSLINSEFNPNSPVTKRDFEIQEMVKEFTKHIINSRSK